MANNPQHLQEFERYVEEDNFSYGDDTPTIVEGGGEALTMDEEIIITKMTE